MSATSAAAALLPEIIPIFPLSGVVLLPHAKLPLNIFEPRYLEMVGDALGQGRVIGMIQPSVAEGQENHASQLYNVGCAGRITSFTETEDGRLLIGLTGICRFTVAEELPMEKSYRRVKPDWQKFISDIHEDDDTEIDRPRLLSILQNYFKQQSIGADWSAVQNTPNDALVSSLAMISSLPPNEKQALLEAPDLRARADMLCALLEMASLPRQEAEGGVRH